MWLLGECLCWSRFPCFNRWVSVSRESFLPPGAAPGCAGTCCGMQPWGNWFAPYHTLHSGAPAAAPWRQPWQGTATVGRQEVVVGKPWLVLPGGCLELLPGPVAGCCPLADAEQ